METRNKKIYIIVKMRNRIKHSTIAFKNLDVNYRFVYEE